MQKFFILWVSLIILFIGGCSTKHYSVSEPKIITLKTPKLKFADTGYIRHDESSVEVELFTAGVAVEKISIDDQVCVSAGCMSEEENLSKSIYTLIIRVIRCVNVLLGKDIFEVGERGDV
jgi:hypothetical protein